MRQEQVDQIFLDIPLIIIHEQQIDIDASIAHAWTTQCISSKL